MYLLFNDTVSASNQGHNFLRMVNLLDLDI
jgi:hypothetical protein